MGHPVPNKVCSAPDCDKSVPDHRWGILKAHGEGWLFQKNGDNWCPEHLPEWVTEWREKQALLKGEEHGPGGNEGQAGS